LKPHSPCFSFSKQTGQTHKTRGASPYIAKQRRIFDPVFDPSLCLSASKHTTKDTQNERRTTLPCLVDMYPCLHPNTQAKDTQNERRTTGGDTFSVKIISGDGQCEGIARVVDLNNGTYQVRVICVCVRACVCVCERVCVCVCV